MKDSDIFYSLTITDIHQVAEESLDRRLTEDEIETVIPRIEERITWFDVIDDVIRENING